MTKYAKEFYIGFILISIICFSPNKIIAYGSPFIFLSYLMLRNCEVRRILLLIYGLIGANIFVYIFYYSLYGNTVLQNQLLTSLTYSSFLPLLLINNRKIAQPYLLKKILAFLSILFLIQGTLGVTQALYSALIVGRGFDVANGDHVEGTIHPAMSAELAFSNPMFATNMTFIGLALLIQYFVYGESKKYRLFVGFFAIILASVMHVLFLAFVSAVIFYLILRPEFAAIQSLRSTVRAKLQRISVKVFLFVFSTFIIAAPIYFLSTNVTLVESFATKTFLGNTPKAKITVDAVTTLPEQYSLFPVFGFGPGQFTSRASLIGSGVYLGGVDSPKSPPLLQNQINPVAQRVLIPYLYESRQKKYLGSTGFPHYSWLSVYSEFGLLGFLSVTFFVVFLLIKAIMRARRSEAHRVVAFLFCTGLGLLYLLGMHENYWEVPQAIFIGVLLLKMLYANLMHLHSFEDVKVGLVPEQDFYSLLKETDNHTA